MQAVAVGGRGTGWQASLAPEARRACVELASCVAQRVVSPVRRARAVAAPPGLAGGDAGIALMCGQLDRALPSSGWDVAAHAALAAAVAGIEASSTGGCGQFTGLGGLAFVTGTLARDRRYSRLLATLDEALAVRAPALIAAVRAGRDGVDPAQVDAISGLSGIAGGLLARAGATSDPATITAVLRTIVDLALSPRGIDRWRASGEVDLGLAHGLAGPLAALAIALSRGAEVPGQHDAIERLARWLVEQRLHDAYGPTWPAVAGSAARVRTAWCYGAPGIARALWLAGRALADEPLQAIAVDAMQAVYRRPVEQRLIDSPTFCHGVAGLLQITLRFAHDTRLACFDCAAAELADQLRAAYDPRALFGYRSLVEDGEPADLPGVLDGAAGVVLVLLAAATNAEPAWDRAFLLA